MLEMHARGCLEPEVVAAYVDHGLSLAERARVETHLASCPPCTALLAGVVRTVAELAPALPTTGETAEATPLVSRRAVSGVAVAAAAVLAILAAPSLVRPWLERDAGLVSLAGKVGEHRSVLGRITGGHPHAPLDSASAGGQDALASGTDRVLLTAGRIRESLGEVTTPARLHALGVEQLLNGRYDDAAQLLLAASREQPANARYLNDVATVQLERARRGLRPDDLPRALAAADRARRLDPSLHEAWFNRGLALSALQLTEHATSAWTEYLRRDSTSPWAGEARKHLEDLARPTPAAAWQTLEAGLQQQIDPTTADAAVRAQTTEARNFIERRMLVAWARAALAGAGEAELQHLRVMSEAMLRVAGDALYVDTVRTIDRANAEQARHLAAAHLGFAAAATAFTNDRFDVAGPQLAEAQSRLAALNSPFALRAAVDLAATQYVSSNYQAAIATLTAARATAEAANYTYVRARASWYEGMTAFAQARLGDAQAKYEDTLATFERMGDTEQAVGAHNLLAGLHFYLGNKIEEWRHHQAGFRGLSVSRSPRLWFRTYLVAAGSLRSEQPETALLLQQAALDALGGAGPSTLSIEVLAARAHVLTALGRLNEAAAAIQAARQHLNAIGGAARELFELIILSPEGELQRRTDAAAAVTTAERAIELIAKRNNPADRSRLPRFHLQLAKANIVWGRLPQAERALANGISAFDEERAANSDEGRFSVVDENWELFETGVQLAIRKGDIERGFVLSERARARTLAEARRAQPTRSLTQIRAGLADGEVVVALNQFEQELAVWIISRDAAEVQTRPLTRRDAQRLVALQQEEIWREGSATVAGRELYNEIMRPFAPQLRRATALVVVPDATYQDVAFAALWDGARGKFLVEEKILRHAASVESYVASTQRETTPTQDSLVVSGPQERAAVEARSIAAVYGNATVVAGTGATTDQVLSSIRGRSIVHLAATTASNQTHPLLSRILLADQPGRRYSGELLGRDIAATSLATTNLVVLDEVSPNNRGEGTLPLVRAFMSAGVPAVLATLPGADETATPDLMIDFHREMTTGIPAGHALSRVQRNALQQNGRRLGAWTALVFYGSDR